MTTIRARSAAVTGTGAAVALGLCAAAGVVVHAGTAALASTNGGTEIYWLPVAGGGVILAAGCVLVRRVERATALAAVLVAGLAFRLALVPTAPALSDDVYRYLWDGKVTTSGVSPYRHPPEAGELAHLRDARLWPLINRKTERTIYPPAAQVVFAAAHGAGIRTPSGWKALMAVADTAAAALLALALARAGRDPREVVAYAWNPLPILAFGHSGHVEALVVLTLSAAAVAWADRRAGRLGVLLGLAGALKLYPLAVLPAFLRERGRPWSWPGALAVTGMAGVVLVLAYLPLLAAGEQALGYLTEGYLMEEGYGSGDRFRLFRAVGLDGRWFVLPIMAVVTGSAVRAAAVPAPRGGAWILGAAILLTLPYPWYTAPLLALAVAGAAGWAWTWFATAIAASYVQPFVRLPWWDQAWSVRMGAALLILLPLLAAVHSTPARRAAVGAED